MIVSIPDHRRSFVRSDLGAIARNVAAIRQLLPRACAFGAVVKADGYGHGAVPAARAALAGGATWLFVATADEAAALRAAGIDARVVVMGALSRAELAIAREADADVVAWRSEFAAALP